jgi:hypothetical protein
MPPKTIVQRKAVATGEQRTWDLDIDAMASTARWARRQPDMLRQEVQLVHEAFPTLVAAVGIPLAEDDGWVEAAEPMLCPGHGRNEIVVFDRGTRCAECGRELRPPKNALVGFIGRIPALISGRPFLDVLKGRISRMERRGDPRAGLFRSSLIDVQGKTYLAPRFAIWFARSWPHSDPPVMVWPEYFEVLDIPPDHVYMTPPYYRLCLYASWLEQPACAVIQNRVVPRLLIDLMMADLAAVGRLDEALDSLDASLYEVYNMVGRPEEGEDLKRVYEELMPRGQRPPDPAGGTDR